MTGSPFSCIPCHCLGVLATILKACTGPSNSSRRMVLTNRCRCRGVLCCWKRSLTTTTLKWVSELAGLIPHNQHTHTQVRQRRGYVVCGATTRTTHTLCMWDSFRTSRCKGWSSSDNFCSMDAETGNVEDDDDIVCTQRSSSCPCCCCRCRCR